ncbi:hypothetical protein SAMN05421547_101560 [Delftia lacustris]|uniref:Uncharacterized protein n=1 Tax=Delftia lacustris TaxID=558537 RepID=A0A1H3F9E8_9BURK|nr:hypothetical protein SAMN05421547_101560 [Delftia lacustris]
MNQHSLFIQFIIGITAGMGAPIYDTDMMPAFSHFTGHHTTGKTRADDKNIIHD